MSKLSLAILRKTSTRINFSRSELFFHKTSARTKLSRRQTSDSHKIIPTNFSTFKTLRSFPEKFYSLTGIQNFSHKYFVRQLFVVITSLFVCVRANPDIVESFRPTWLTCRTMRSSREIFSSQRAES